MAEKKKKKVVSQRLQTSHPVSNRDDEQFAHLELLPLDETKKAFPGKVGIMEWRTLMSSKNAANKNSTYVCSTKIHHKCQLDFEYRRTKHKINNLKAGRKDGSPKDDGHWLAHSNQNLGFKRVTDFHPEFDKKIPLVDGSIVHGMCFLGETRKLKPKVVQRARSKMADVTDQQQVTAVFSKKRSRSALEREGDDSVIADMPHITRIGGPVGQQVREMSEKLSSMSVEPVLDKEDDQKQTILAPSPAKKRKKNREFKQTDLLRFPVRTASKAARAVAPPEPVQSQSSLSEEQRVQSAVLSAKFERNPISRGLKVKGLVHLSPQQILDHPYISRVFKLKAYRLKPKWGPIKRDPSLRMLFCDVCRTVYHCGTRSRSNMCCPSHARRCLPNRYAT